MIFFYKKNKKCKKCEKARKAKKSVGDQNVSNRSILKDKALLEATAGITAMQRRYIKKHVNEEAPGMMIRWNDERVEEALHNVANMSNLPSCPSYLDISDSARFKASIRTRLLTVAGGNLGDIFAPNSGCQICNLATLLVYIESDPFIQALCVSVGAPLAQVTFLVGLEGVLPGPPTKPAPPEPLVQVFA